MNFSDWWFIYLTAALMIYGNIMEDRKRIRDARWREAQKFLHKLNRYQKRKPR